MIVQAEVSERMGGGHGWRERHVDKEARTEHLPDLLRACIYQIIHSILASSERDIMEGKGGGVCCIFKVDTRGYFALTYYSNPRPQLLFPKTKESDLIPICRISSTPTSISSPRPAQLA